MERKGKKVICRKDKMRRCIEQEQPSTLENRFLYGDVRTKFNFIDKLLDMLPSELFGNEQLEWLDPCCGDGRFPALLYERLDDGLMKIIPNNTKRKKHIIKKMLHMVEFNGEYIPQLVDIFGWDANISQLDFLSMRRCKFDIIIGNPPYGVCGDIKTPTARLKNKRGDGQTVWGNFVTIALDNLKEGGYLAMIVPSIWMKRDHKYHKIFCRHRVLKVKTFSNTQAKDGFIGGVAVPTSLFLVQKYPRSTIQHTLLYDRSLKEYISYAWESGESLPVFGASIVARLRPYTIKYGYIKVTKTNSVSRKINLGVKRSTALPYANISTCRLRGDVPIMHIEFSSRPCSFAGISKLILAHKMYGLPFADPTGLYGVSRRDNYVILATSEHNQARLLTFLSTRFARYLFESTRYRMKMLERYAFELIPDITAIEAFPEEITETSIGEFFGLTDKEKLAIEGKDTSDCGYLAGRRPYKLPVIG